MGTDRYTKVLLTIIAGCLLWLSIGGTRLLPSARAQTPLVDIAPPVQIARPFPTVIKGTDFGYRVDGLRKGEAPIGTLVVQIDGAWYEAGLHYQK